MVSRSTAAGVAATLMTALAATACSPGSQAPSSDGSIQVVASFYPLAEAVQRVGGGLVRVENLTAPGVEPHDLELTPHQVEAIATADLVVYLGGGFQPAVEDALGDASGATLDASASIRTLPVPSGASDETLSADPHVWLDPTLYERIVGEVRDALARVDPADARTFADNAGTYDHELERLDRDYRDGLADCSRTVVLTSHAAFGYLAERYGLTQEPITGSSPEAEPAPQRIADLKDVVEREGVTTIFTEELVSPDVAETLASETGATTAVLSPLESLTPDQASSGADYVSVMRQELATLRGALGCA
jgi:zinc transport system substrate-binding protein